MLSIRNVSKIYRMGENEVYALRDASVEIERGDFVAIMGPSGSGKSTLMNVLGLLDTPTSGSYFIDGVDASALSDDDLALLRRRTIGFVFQQFNLLPRMTALGNVTLPQFYSGASDDGHQRALELLAQVGLSDRAAHKTNELSGGQQQRVAIARALVNAPSLLLADEPTGNLDSKSEHEIMAILKSLNERGITIIIVTHEEEIGAQAKRRIRMRDGAVQKDERLRPRFDGSGSSAISQEPVLNTTNPPPVALARQLLGHLQQAMRALASNWVRTALSMLGILIGVAAVITMLAIGSGASKAIAQQLSSLGSNLLILRPGATQVGGVRQEARATRLSLEDAQALASSLTFIGASSPVVAGRAQVTYSNKNWNTEVSGVSPSYAEMRAARPTRGRFFTEAEGQSRSMVAVIGTTVARELFGERDPLGELIKVNKLNFQIIGILPMRGATGPRDQDDIILIPAQTAMRRLFGKSYVDSIELQITNTAATHTGSSTVTEGSADLESATDRIIEFMNERHNVPEAKASESFRVFNMADIQKALSSTSQTMSTLLAAIAAISLLVGGIGIMNIMLVSVTERTREIGLRKAVGARRADILMQFMVESVVMTLTGGLCGIAVGWLATVAIARTSGWSTSIEPSAVLMAFAFSAGIGMIFGIYPAHRASTLHPIQALRHE